MNPTTTTAGEPTASTSTEAAIIHEEYVEPDTSHLQRTLNSYGTEGTAAGVNQAIKWVTEHALNMNMAAFEVMPTLNILFDVRDSVLIAGRHVNLTR